MFGRRWTAASVAAIAWLGAGFAMLVLQGRLVTLDATTRGAAIPTGKKVRVDAVEGAGLLVVSAS